MPKGKSEFLSHTRKQVGDWFNIEERALELHFWCKSCIRGWRYAKPATPEEISNGHLVHLFNHAAAHTTKAAAPARR